MTSLTSQPRRYPALAAFLAVTFAASAIGSWATIDNVRTWYPTIAKPSWTPPNWLFGPVWTTLYVLIGVSLWRVLRRGALRRDPAAGLLFGLHWILNFLWSYLFLVAF